MITFRDDMKVELVEFYGGDERVVESARVSTQGSGSREPQQGVQGLIRFLMREQHHVPFEHSGFTFYIEAPIFVTRQILKHRTTSISEESGRYRVLDQEFYVPGPDRPLKQIGKTGDYEFETEVDPAFSDDIDQTMRLASRISADCYDVLLEHGVAKEVARMILPVNTYSSLYLTMNARNALHFLKLRTDPHAQYEIRQVAHQMEDIFAEKMPETYTAWQTYVAG